MEYKEKIHDAITGEITWRNYTSKEIADAEADHLRSQAETETEAVRTAEKAALLAKLGITDDEAKLLLS